MRTRRGALVLAALAAVCGASLLALGPGQEAQREGSPAPVIRYAADGTLSMPQDYREWIFLSSGMDMSYNARLSGGGAHLFNNVFASPAAYRSFQQTGTWPDKTMLVLEIRDAERQPTLNRHGQTQSRRVSGLEVHLKDEARFPGGWAFFDVGSDGRGRLFQPTAKCYRCHEQHAAVDTTFAQFYPTLLPAAEVHRTFSPAYLKELKDIRSAGRR